MIPKDDIIEIALEGVDHLIPKPREVYVEENGLELSSLEVIDAEGTHQIIVLKDPMMLPAPAAQSHGEGELIPIETQGLSSMLEPLSGSAAHSIGQRVCHTPNRIPDVIGNQQGTGLVDGQPRPAVRGPFHPSSGSR